MNQSRINLTNSSSKLFTRCFEARETLFTHADVTGQKKKRNKKLSVNGVKMLVLVKMFVLLKQMLFYVHCLFK